MRTARDSEMRPRFLTELQHGLRRCGAAGSHLLVALSGGADSVALLRGLLDLRSSLDLTLRAAHLNHQLRGAASDADAEWVQKLCQRWNVPCDIAVAPVADLAEQSRRGIEETAREERYRYLSWVAATYHCSDVATAHTADDQAETVLHHILRGTGLTGLRGIPWTRPFGAPDGPPSSLRLIRPMLAIWRSDLEQYLSELHQDFRLDESNRDVSLTRNRLRRELLPQLERDFNPRVRRHLCELAEQAAEFDRIVDMAANGLLQSALLDCSPRVVRLHCDALANVPRALVREVLVRLWQRQNWPQADMTFAHWDRLAQCAQSPASDSSAYDLPGPISVQRRASLLLLQSIK